MALATTTIEYVDADLDLWCLDCMLSTAVRVWYTVTRAGTSTLESGAVCLECRGRRVED